MADSIFDHSAGNRTRPGPLSVFVFIVFTLLSHLSVQGQTTRHVPGQYATIQDAVDASSDGDVVLVSCGTYTGVGNREILLGDRNIQILSEEGPRYTVIDCEGLGRALDYVAGETGLLEGFTIRNGRAPSDGGGALKCDGATPTIRNCRFENNTTTGDGGAVIVLGAAAEPRFEGCWFIGNASDGQGGAVYVDVEDGGSGARTQVDMVDCVIAFNSSQISGGGVYLYGHPGGKTSAASTLAMGDGDVILENCTLTGNEAVSNGGGVCVFPGALCEMTRSIIWGNCAGDQGDELYTDALAGYLTGYAELYCSDIGPGVSQGSGFVCITMDEHTIRDDPLLCDQGSCVSPPAGDTWYRLQSGSPCLATASPCGAQIGASGLECGDWEQRFPEIHLVSDFNGFSATSHPMTQTSPGVWEVSADVGVGCHQFRFQTGHSIDCPPENYMSRFAFDPACGVGITGEVRLRTEGNDIGLVEFTIAGRYMFILDEQNLTYRIEGYPGRPLYVPSQYPTLQDALNVAFSWDMVLVAPGVYRGPQNRDLDMNGYNVIVMSEQGAEVTAIDCESAGRAFHFHSGENSNAWVRGFTITRGNADGGGAILCEDSSPSIFDCRFDQNQSTSDGGAILIEGDSSPVIETNWFTGNSAARRGGAICALQPYELVADWSITDCLIIHNSALDGGGVFAGEPFFDYPTNNQGSLSMSGCTVASNLATGQGGGVLVSLACEADISRSILRLNCPEDLFAVCNWSWGEPYFGSAVLTCCNAVTSGLFSECAWIQDITTVQASTRPPGFCNPGFCDWLPAPYESYGLHESSACLAANSPCGQQIGVFGEMCSGPSAVGSGPGSASSLSDVRTTPNPFNPRTVISFDLYETTEVSVRIYDVSGRHVRTLVSRKSMPAGRQEIPWEGRDGANRPVSAGVYFYHVTAGGEIAAGRMTLVK